MSPRAFRPGIEANATPRFVPALSYAGFPETRFSLDDASPNRIRFDVERVMRTQYHIDDFQETYFVIGDFDELLELARIDFGPLYEHVKAKADIDPGEILDSDAVISRGTRAYHNAKRAGR